VDANRLKGGEADLREGDELLCILFTDLVGWTELGDRVGDDVAHALRRDHFQAVRDALEAHRGREVKTAGDSVMATFRSAVDAVRCALAIQDAVRSTPLQVRVGVHAGEPIADEGDVFGTAVNLASRLCGAAAPGQVLVSEVTRSLVGRRGAFQFEAVGPLSLKGLSETVPAAAVRSMVGGASSVPAVSTTAPSSRRLERVERSLLCPVLLEREHEVAALGAAVDGLRAGGGLAILVGEAGVGKTRLTQEVVARAREGGVHVLSGRAVPSATPVPYRPLTEAFLGAFRSASPPTAPELAGFGGQLGRLVPEWRGDAPGGADESPILLGEAIVRLLRVVGGDDGCVLVLEDLHWADVETLAVVEYLADTLRDERVLCVCTARPEGAAIDSLSRLRRLASVAVLGVARLGPGGIERAVAACLGVESPPSGLVESIASNSDGNPFLIEELLAGLVAADALRLEDGRWTAAGRLTPSIPFDFGESVRQRLSVLDGTARKVVRAAALLGRRFDWDLLPGLVDVDGRTVVDALRVAVDEQLIEVVGNDFGFRHALTREAILAELLPPERQDLARRALPAVEGAHPRLPGVWCEMAAELAETAGEPSTAARHLLESARRALASGALASAESIACRVKSIGVDDSLLDDADDVLVHVLALAGKPDEAAAIGDALVDRLSAPDGATERIGSVLVVLARAALAAGDAARAHDLIERARRALGDFDDAFAARVEAVAAHVALEQARLDDARRLAHAAIARARATDQPAVECEALEVLGRADRYLGPADRHDADGAAVRAPFERAAALAERHGLALWKVRASHELALMSLYVEGDMEPLNEARALAARSGALVSVAVMDLALAEIGLSGFDREQCLESAQRCVDASRRYGLATLPVAYLWLAGGHALADDPDAMEAAGAASLKPDPDDPRILGDLWGRVRAASSMVRDDRGQLRRDLDAMMTYVRVAPITTSLFPNRLLWALVHTIEDDDHGAAARAELDAATHLRAWPMFAVSLGMIDAVASGCEGRVEEASDQFSTAARGRVWGLDEGSFQYFHVLAAEAAIRDGWGDPAAWLLRAEAFFAERGYARIVRRCRSLLADAGAPVPRRGRDSLVPEKLRALGVTSRELDVLQLVAEGLSNREVADRLFLSPKTVERHLSSLFDRTGRRTRGALADLLRELSG
jgi:class 3 adenylate cyclase/DNA-binding CsgD family transcriptional regulator